MTTLTPSSRGITGRGGDRKALRGPWGVRPPAAYRPTLPMLWERRSDR
jgi:hypothetical protein